MSTDSPIVLEDVPEYSYSIKVIDRSKRGTDNYKIHKLRISKKFSSASEIKDQCIEIDGFQAAIATAIDGFHAAIAGMYAIVVEGFCFSSQAPPLLTRTCLSHTQMYLHKCRYQAPPLQVQGITAAM